METQLGASLHGAVFSLPPTVTMPVTILTSISLPFSGGLALIAALPSWLMPHLSNDDRAGNDHIQACA